MDTFLDPQFLISPADLAARMGRADASCCSTCGAKKSFQAALMQERAERATQLKA